MYFLFFFDNILDVFFFLILYTIDWVLPISHLVWVSTATISLQTINQEETTKIKSRVNFKNLQSGILPNKMLRDILLSKDMR